MSEKDLIKNNDSFDDLLVNNDAASTPVDEASAVAEASAEVAEQA